jgi:hypothetical protein
MAGLRPLSALGLALVVWLVGCSLAIAAPLKLNFTFQGPSGATAIGWVTVESSAITNPGGFNFILPNPAVLDLQVVVSGASAGNGTFGISDFSSIFLDTGGGTLNFSSQLIGQPTLDAPFGTTDGCALGGPLGGTGGDFNMFNLGGGPPPSGAWYFTLVANSGAADCMVLTSLIAANAVAAPVPTLSEWGLVTLCVLLAGVAFVSLRRRSLAA